MSERSRPCPRPLFQRDLSWDPFRDRVQPSRIFDQDFGLPPFLTEGDLHWIDWTRRRLCSSWPGYLRSPLFAPSSLHTQAGLGLQRQLTGGVSEIRTGPDSWKITLDVNHFSPDEISIKTKEGYLEIEGKHEERQDEHGFVSRCFTRKYKLPSEVEAQNISSSLSPDGILSVEAPLPKTASGGPVEIVIPVQVENKTETLKEEEEEEEGKHTQQTGETEEQPGAAEGQEDRDPAPQVPSDEPADKTTGEEGTEVEELPDTSEQQAAPTAAEEETPGQAEQCATADPVEETGSPQGSSEKPAAETVPVQGASEEPVLETELPQDTSEELVKEGPAAPEEPPSESQDTEEEVPEKQDSEQPEEAK
ncbi:heat shock protein beta-1 [Amia ocellicauda]|uniref:heat shock protein beta-1 n=1 Tax=Amia ocellicauda TaxID=2972642 RepID=UPI0034648409